MEMSRRAADLYRVDMAAALLPPGQPHPEFELQFVEAAAGFGVVQSLLAVSEKLGIDRTGHEAPLKGLRMAVQGSGVVGTGAMLFASRLGAEVVAVSDAEGVAYAPDGFDVESLLARRARALSKLPQAVRLQAAKVLVPYVRQSSSNNVRVLTNAEIEREIRVFGGGVDGKLVHLLRTADSVNVLVLAASRYVWSEQAVQIACEGMWKNVHPRVMVAGANNPFRGMLESDSAVPPTSLEIKSILNELRRRQVIHVPDFRANGGTAQLFHCYASGELDWIFEDTTSGIPVLTREEQAQGLEVTSYRIKRVLRQDLDRCGSSALELPSISDERVVDQLARELPFDNAIQSGT
jgi:hypothetical protein